MKIKFPKSVLIGDVEFRVIADKNRDDAEFYYWSKEKSGDSFSPPTIIIGTKYKNTMPIRILSNIIHELKEIIQNEQGTRTIIQGGDEFHYNHREHTDLCNRLAGLLSLFLE